VTVIRPTDRERIAKLERDVERIEEAVMVLAKHAYQDKRGYVWWPQWGPIAALKRRNTIRRKAKERAAMKKET
jgi:hypothetical protein